MRDVNATESIKLICPSPGGPTQWHRFPPIAISYFRGRQCCRVRCSPFARVARRHERGAGVVVSIGETARGDPAR